MQENEKLVQNGQGSDNFNLHPSWQTKLKYERVFRGFSVMNEVPVHVEILECV